MERVPDPLQEGFFTKSLVWKKFQLRLLWRVIQVTGEISGSWHAGFVGDSLKSGFAWKGV